MGVFERAAGSRFQPAGLQELGQITLTRRSFLGSLSFFPALSYATPLLATAPCDSDLRFDWNEDKTVLTVRYVEYEVAKFDSNPGAAANRTAACIVKPKSDADLEKAHWAFPTAAFGPRADFRLRALNNGNGIDGYDLQVVGVAFGRNGGRQMTFEFRREAGIWTLKLLSDFWSSKNSATSFQPFTLGKNTQPTVAGSVTVPIPLLDFLAGTVSLEQIVPANRVTHTFFHVFDGHIRGGGAILRLKLDRNFIWYVGGNNGGYVETFDGRVKLFDFRFARCISTEKSAAACFDAQSAARKTKAAAADLVEDVDDAAVIAAATPILSIVGLTFGSIAGQHLLAIPAPPRALGEVPAFAARGVTASNFGGAAIDRPAEIMLSGPWDLSVLRGSAIACGTLTNVACVVRRTLDTIHAGGGSDPSLGARTTTVSGRLPVSDEWLLDSPVGGIVVRGGEEKPPAPAEGQPPDPAALPLSPFSEVAALPFQARITSPAMGNPLSSEQLTHLDIATLLLQSHAALPDAGLSSLIFRPTELRLLGGAKAPDILPPSYIWLGQPAGTMDRGRFDLSRAKLSASRSLDLVSLKFGFSDLSLAFGATARILPKFDECRVVSRNSVGQSENARTLEQPDVSDSRPVLVVEFPPQHVMEEALFLPQPPPLPDARVDGDAPIVCDIAKSGAITCRRLTPEEFKPGNPPPDPRLQLRFHPNDRNGIENALSRMRRSEDRVALRTLIAELKSSSVAPGAAVDAKHAKTFEIFAKAYSTAVRPTPDPYYPPIPPLPENQRIYVGPFALDPDARALAAVVQRTLRAQGIAELFDNSISNVLTQFALLVQPGSEPVTLPDALSLEGKLESTVPSYQLFRTFYRELMISLGLGDKNGLDVGSDDSWWPRNLDASEIEYCLAVSDTGPHNCNWLLDTDERDRRFKRYTEVRQAYLKYLSGADLISELVHARLSRPSRLAFRVNCADGRRTIPAEKSQEPSTSIPYTLSGLTDWSTHELSVVRRAEKLFDYDRAGVLGHRGPRRLNINDGAMLDHLGFKRGDYVTANDRLMDIQRSLASPPSPLETSLEIPARLVLSPAQDAVWRTPRELPPSVTGKPSMSPDGSIAKDGSTRHPLWSVGLMRGGPDPAVRAVHSPDLVDGFVWQRHQRSDSKGFFGDGLNIRLPGGAAPPRGPIAPG